MKLVRIEWHDAFTMDEWTEDILDTMPTCYTVGYIVNETEEFIVVAQTLEESESVGKVAGQMLIPRGTIKVITVLEEASP